MDKKNIQRPKGFNLTAFERELASQGIDQCKFSEILQAAQEAGLKIAGKSVTAPGMQSYLRQQSVGDLSETVEGVYLDMVRNDRILAPSCRIYLTKPIEKQVLL